MTKSPNPFRWFDSSPEVIRLVVMMYVRYPLLLRNDNHGVVGTLTPPHLGHTVW